MCSTLLVCLLSPFGSEGKESACDVGDLGSSPGSGRSPGEGKPVFLPGESHGQRIQAGYRSWAHMSQT